MAHMRRQRRTWNTTRPWFPLSTQWAWPLKRGAAIQKNGPHYRQQWRRCNETLLIHSQTNPPAPSRPCVSPLLDTIMGYSERAHLIRLATRKKPQVRDSQLSHSPWFILNTVFPSMAYTYSRSQLCSTILIPSPFWCKFILVNSSAPFLNPFLPKLRKIILVTGTWCLRGSDRSQKLERRDGVTL